MNTQTFKPKAYLKDGCPFSFKFWLFMVEAGIADQIEVIRCNPNDSRFAQIKAILAKGLGRSATFPTVEMEPGQYKSDSDSLIEHFAARNGIDAARLPALAFYKETLFPQVVELHKLKGD
jgi:glutathione S-transferase-like protein